MKGIHILSAFFLLVVAGCSKNEDTNALTIPASPSELIATVVSSTQVNLQWRDNSTNETGYKVERKQQSENFAQIGSTAENIVIYTDDSLTPGTTYTYRVVAYNSAGNSLVYSNEVEVTTSGGTVDLPNVTISNQIWSKQNLTVSQYRNGDPIPNVTDPTQWVNLSSGAWCWYNNDSINYAQYGKLYNWYAVNDPRGLAPLGWHVSTDAEWTTLTDFLGGESVAGGKLKITGTQYWESPNTGATNITDFSALPGGLRGGSFTGGSFQFSIGRNGAWWTSTSSDQANEWIWIRTMRWDQNSVYRTVNDKNSGYSVRLVKD
jgi:uncharacterized protein (TIGR02145 family)